MCAAGTFADDAKPVARLDTSSLANFTLSINEMLKGLGEIDHKRFLDLIATAALPSADKMTPVQALVSMGVRQAPPSPEMLAAMKPLDGKNAAEFIAALEQMPPVALPAILEVVTLADIQSAMQDDGFRAKIVKDGKGDYVASSTGGAGFFVSLDGCALRRLIRVASFYLPRVHGRRIRT